MRLRQGYLKGGCVISSSCWSLQLWALCRGHLVNASVCGLGMM